MRTKDGHGFNKRLHLLRRRGEKTLILHLDRLLWGRIDLGLYVFISFRRRRVSSRCFRPPSVGDLLSCRGKNNRVGPQLRHWEHPGVVFIPPFPLRRCLAPIRVTGACGGDPGSRRHVGKPELEPNQETTKLTNAPPSADIKKPQENQIEVNFWGGSLLLDQQQPKGGNSRGPKEPQTQRCTTPVPQTHAKH